MRKTIVRTITATTIESAKVSFKDGIPTATANKSITVNGVIDEAKALKEVRKVYGDNAQITAIKQVDDVYEISVEDFMKYAKKVEVATPEPTAEPEKKEDVNSLYPSQMTDAERKQNKEEININYGKATAK